MFKVLKARLHQKNRTFPFPQKMPTMDPRYAGRPVVFPQKCKQACTKCYELCPTGAITPVNGKVTIDLGKCLFCRECEKICPEKAIQFTSNFVMGATCKEDLIVLDEQIKAIEPMKPELQKLFKQSLKLRQVSAGGCNACEADCNVLTTPTFDMARFGITFVASPRHADGLLITGPVTKNMKEAMLKAYKALPSPKLVIAVGTCAISGGLFAGNNEVCDGIGDLLPVDIYIPGCPPNPWTILNAIYKHMGN